MKRIGTCLQFTLLFFSENHGSLPLFDIDSQLSHYCDELPKNRGLFLTDCWVSGQKMANLNKPCGVMNQFL